MQPSGTTLSLEYTVSDSSGNTGTATRTITLVDTTPPRIQLAPGAALVQPAGEAFEPLAMVTATDMLDGQLPVVVDGQVVVLPPSVPANFSLLFRAVDDAGNEASVTFTVTVDDTQGPTLRLVPGPDGMDTVKVPYGTVFRDPGVDASDPAGLAKGLAPGQADLPGGFDVSRPDNYSVTYTAYDIYSNAASTVRRVVVEPFQLPGPRFIHRMILDVDYDNRPPLSTVEAYLREAVDGGYVFVVTERRQGATQEDFNLLPRFTNQNSEEDEDALDLQRRAVDQRTVLDWVARNATTLDWIPATTLKAGAEKVALLLNITLLPPTPTTATGGAGGSSAMVAAAAGVAAGIIVLVVIVLVLVRRRRQRQQRVADSIGKKSAPKPKAAVFGKRDRMALAREDVHFGPRLGHFTAGDVYEARLLGDSHGGEPCLAIKADDDVGGGFPALAAEVRAAQALRKHVNILPLVGRCAQARPPIVLVAPASHGSLWHVLRRARRGELGMSHAGLLQLASGAAAGMEAVHGYQMIHRNLSSRAIVVAEGPSGLEAKIADFAVVQYVATTGEEEKRPLPSPLSPRWQAPEVLAGAECSSASDVWSLGVVIWELYTLAATPYCKLADDEVAKELGRRNRLPRPKHCSSTLYQELLVQTWRSRAESRMTVGRVAARLRRESAALQVSHDATEASFFEADSLEPVAAFDETDPEALVGMTGFQLDAAALNDYAGSDSLMGGVVASSSAHGMYAAADGGWLRDNPSYALAEPTTRPTGSGTGWMTYYPTYTNPADAQPAEDGQATGPWLEGSSGSVASRYDTLGDMSAPGSTVYSKLSSRATDDGSAYAGFGDMQAQGDHRYDTFGSSRTSAAVSSAEQPSYSALGNADGVSSSFGDAPAQKSYDRLSRMETDDSYEAVDVPPGSTYASMVSPVATEVGVNYNRLDRDAPAGRAEAMEDDMYADPAPLSLPSVNRASKDRTSRRLAAVSSRTQPKPTAGARREEDWDAEA